MKISKESIDLFQKIEEKYKKDIKCGDWLYFEDGLYLVTEIIKTPENVDIYTTNFGKAISADDDILSLWTIPDCLEFFKESAMYLEGLCQTDEEEYMCSISELDDLGVIRGTVKSFEGETPLEACLRTVFAIVESS